MTVWNDVLIPRFKEAFTLNYFQAMLVQFAFFGAYGIGSLIYYLISMTSGDPINRIGYKNGVIIGLLIAATGSALFFSGGGVDFVSLFPDCVVHRGTGLCDVADCGKSLCHDPWPGGNGVQPVEPFAGVQFVRHDHRPDHWRLVDLHLFYQQGRARG